MIVSRSAVLAILSPFLLEVVRPAAAGEEVCTNRTGSSGGFFFTFWKSGGDGCVILSAKGRYVSRYRLAAGENLVVGKGWQLGSVNRQVGYRVDRFDAGSNSYLALYGWSRNPLVETYVVENWGRGFTPPGRSARALGVVHSDGGTYTVYRTQRIQQPSIRGIATFYQYWSVRTARRPAGKNNIITFANHVAAWRALGMELGTMDYQVLATEGFGSSGGSDVVVWQQ